MEGANERRKSARDFPVKAPFGVDSWIESRGLSGARDGEKRFEMKNCNVFAIRKS